MGFVILFFLLFFVKQCVTESDGDFFKNSFEQETDWNPSDDFFDNMPNQFAKNLEQIPKRDQLRLHSKYNIKKPEVSPDFIDVIEQVVGSSKTREKNNLSTEKTIPQSKEELQYKAYFARFIKMFLKSIGLVDSIIYDDSKTVTVDITFSKRDLAVLKNFGSDDDISLEELEKSFTSVFKSVNKENISKYSFEISPFLKYAIILLSLVTGAVCTVYLIIKLKINKILLVSAMCIAYLSVVSFDLLQQYEDIGDQMIIKRREFESINAPPKECFLSQMSYVEKFYFHLFGEKDICDRFLISRKSIWSQVDVASAFGKPIYVIFMKLCSVLGQGAEGLIKPITDKCPWPLNGVLYFILSFLQLPLLIFSLCIIISTLSSGSISLNIPFFSITSERGKVFEKYGIPSIQPKKTWEDIQPSTGTHIINQGGIILFTNNHTALDGQISGKNLENLKLSYNKDSGNHLTQFSYLKNTEMISANKEGNSKESINDFNRKLQCNEVQVIKEEPNTGSKAEAIVSQINESSGENKTPMFFFSTQLNSMKLETIFEKQITSIADKLRKKNNASFKRIKKKKVLSKWKNVTDDAKNINVKHLCKPCPT